jgi:mono/diheme cytochrome c family protein
MNISRCTLLALLSMALAGTAWRAGEPPKPGKLSKQEQAALQPGLTLRFFHADAPDKAIDAHRVRLAALHLGAEMPPSPFVDPGHFTAKLRGYLKIVLKGEFTFRIATLGSATLHINGKLALKVDNRTADTPQPIPLAKGYNRIEIAYVPPARGASLRVYWSSESFTTEPLPPELLFCRGDEPELLRGEERRGGRSLYATRGCARCHTLPDHVKEDELAMPEMRLQRAPSLDGVGRRLRTAWTARWILDPRSLRPEARMPRILHGEASKPQAADLAAYLATLQSSPVLTASAPTEERIAQGETHFANLGCVACHHFDNPTKADPMGRLSLFYVRNKYQSGALEAFLKAPHRHYPWIRMPDFHLDANEAQALAAFLLDRAKGPELTEPKGDAANGVKLFEQMGCVNCHAVKPGAQPAPKLRPRPNADTFTQGCLAATPKQAPDFGFKAAELQTLRTFVTSGGPSLKRDTPAEFSLRQVKELQCQACHRRDGHNSRWNDILEDEGLMSQFLPSLTWAGEKLKPAWTTKLLAAMHDHRARPWLKARMPGFPARAEMLALGMSHEHGFRADEDDAPVPDAKLAAIGEKLIEQQNGFNCVMCHAVGKRPAVAPFEAPGINLLDAAARLRHNYYPRWMIDPPHVDITTRMPKFSQDGKTTPLRNILDGDAFRQYDAVWHFIQTLPAK